MTHLDLADLNRFETTARARLGNADQVALEYAVASEVLISFLGREWWRRRLAPTDKGDSYFAWGEDEESRFNHQNRVLAFARHIYFAQALPGFEDLLESMKTRDVAGIACEVEVAFLFTKAGHAVTLVPAQGIKGQDYDLQVDGALAVEVKVKVDSTTFTDSALRNPLRDARKQLPAAGPSLTVLRIPRSWINSEVFRSTAAGILERVLRGTSRINAVVLVWEEWVPIPPSGAACVTKWRVFHNPAPRTAWSGLDDVFNTEDLQPRRGLDHYRPYGSGLADQ